MKKYYFLLMIAFGLSLQASDGTEFDRYQEQVTRYYASVALQAHLHQYVYSEINKRLDDGVEQSGCNMNSDMEQQYGDNVDCKSIEQLLADITKDQSRVTCDQKVIQNQLAAIYNQYEFLEKNTPWDLDQYMQSSYQLHNNLSSCLEVTHDRQLLLNYWKKRLIEQQQASSAILLDSQVDVPLQELDSQSTKLDQVAKKKKKKKQNQDILQQQAAQAKELQRQKDLQRNAQLKAIQIQEETEKKAAEDQRRHYQKMQAIIKNIAYKQNLDEKIKFEKQKDFEENLLLNNVEKKDSLGDLIFVDNFKTNLDILLIRLQIPNEDFYKDDHQIDSFGMSLAGAIVNIENMARKYDGRIEIKDIISKKKQYYLECIYKSEQYFDNLFIKIELESDIYKKLLASQKLKDNVFQDMKIRLGNVVALRVKIQRIKSLIDVIKKKIENDYVLKSKLSVIQNPDCIKQQIEGVSRSIMNVLKKNQDIIHQKELLVDVISPEIYKIWPDKDTCLSKTYLIINQAIQEFESCRLQCSNYLDIKSSINCRRQSFYSDVANKFNNIGVEEIVIIYNLENLIIDQYCFFVIK